MVVPSDAEIIERRLRQGGVRQEALRDFCRTYVSQATQ
jgi:hypothetical protein